MCWNQNPFCSSQPFHHWKECQFAAFTREGHWARSLVPLRVGKTEISSPVNVREELFHFTAPICSPFPQQFPHRVLLSTQPAKPEFQQCYFKSSLQWHAANWASLPHAGNTWPLEGKNDLGRSQGGTWTVLVETFWCFLHPEENAGHTSWYAWFVTAQPSDRSLPHTYQPGAQGLAKGPVQQK